MSFGYNDLQSGLCTVSRPAKIRGQRLGASVIDRANLTKRDREILETLTLRVRVLAVEQVGAEWFAGSADPLKNAVRRMRELAHKGCVDYFTASVRPPLKLTAPLSRWQPGLPAPELARISGMLGKRWTAPLARMPLVSATRAAGIWFGGDGGRRPRRSEASHDLTVAAVYLKWRRQSTRSAEWLSEARLRRLGYGDERRLPDAMIQEGQHRTVIEIGGAYSTAKLVEFHEFCFGEGLPYEIW